MKYRNEKKRIVTSVVPVLGTLIDIWPCWTLDIVCSGPTFWGSQGICPKWCFRILQLWWADWIFGRKWRFWLCWLFPCWQGLPQLHRMPREGWRGISRSKGEFYTYNCGIFTENYCKYLVVVRVAFGNIRNATGICV